MATLRDAKRQLTRRLLLDSGLELFQRRGYAATTIDEIASNAGTTRVTFYAYFSSRSDLMRALIGERLNEALARVWSPDHGSTAPSLVSAVVEGTAQSLGAWLRQTADGWAEVRPIIAIGRAAAANDPDLEDLVEQWLAEAVADIADGLNRAGRLEPWQRHFRGVLAMAELDYVAQNWPKADWHVTRDQMITELTASWVRLLN